MSKDLNRCPACNGSKQVVGMGLLIKDCDACHGIGYIEIERPKVEQLGETIVKKRGRKKKAA